jgi:hypothetical protein
MKYLVIVESPSKCKKIEKYLNDKNDLHIYEVVATMGHITALPSLKHIDFENHFIFYRLWVRNRYFIVSQLTDKKYKPTFHWCNFGKSIILFIFIAKNPVKSVTGLAGMAFGYFDLIRKQNAG